MKIKTAYPLIVDNDKLDMNEYYANAAGTSTPETYSAGDVSVSTSYPVVIDGTDVSSKDFYANADGATPSMPEQVSAKQKGLFWDKVKGGWSKISNSPGAQFALEKVAEFMKNKQGGGFGSGGFTGGMPDSTPTPAPTPAAEPMSKTTKIVLVVGGVLVVGLVLVGVFAKKK